MNSVTLDTDENQIEHPSHKENQPIKGSKVKWLFKFLFKILLSIIPIILILLVILLSTSIGLKGLVWTAQKLMPELVIDNVSGSLLSTSHISGLKYSTQSTDNIDVRLTTLDLSLNTGCIWRKTACIDLLSINGFYFKMPLSPSEDQPEQTKASKPFNMPIGIELNQLILNDIELHIGAYRAKWDRFNSSAEIKGKLLHLKPTSWDSILVQLPDAVESNAKPSTAPNPKPPAQLSSTVSQLTNRQMTFPGLRLPKIDLPINMIIDPIIIKDLKISQKQQQIVKPDMKDKITNKKVENQRVENYLIDRIELGAELANQKLQLNQFDIKSTYADLSVNSKIIFDDKWPTLTQLTLQTKPLLNKLVPSIEIPNQLLTVSLNGDLSSLQLKINMAGETKESGLNAYLEGSLDLTTDNYPFNISLKSEKLFWPLKAISLKKEDQAKAKVKTADKKSSNLNYYQLTDFLIEGKGSLASYTASVRAKALGSQIPTSELLFDASGNLEELTIQQLKVDSLGGMLEANATLHWKDQLNWKAELKTTKLNFQKYWKDLPATLNSQIIHTGSISDDGTIILDLEKFVLDGSLYKEPLKGNGNIHAEFRENQLLPIIKIDNLEVSHYGNKLIVNGGLNRKWDASVDIKVKDIKRSIPQLSGSINSNLLIKGEPLQPDISIDLNGKNIRKGENSLASMSAKGLIKLEQPIRTDLTINLLKSNFSGTTLNKLLLTLKGDEKSHKLNLVLNSNPLKSDLNLDGHFDRSSMSWNGELLPNKMLTTLGDFILSKPVDLMVSKEKVTVSQHCWSLKSSALCLDKQALFSEPLGDAQIRLKEFPLAALNLFLPKGQSLQGSLNVDSKVYWKTGDTPVISLDAQLGHGQYQQDQKFRPFTLGWDSLKLTANLKNNRLDSDLAFQLTNNGKITAQSLLTGIDSNDPMTKTKIVISALKPELVNRLLVSSGVRIGGEINSNLNLNGHLLEPDINGLFHWSNLSARGSTLPMPIDDSSDLKINFLGKSLTLVSQVVSDTNKLSLNGDARWKSFEQWEASLVTTGDNVAIEIPPTVSLKASPKITINAKPNQVDIIGDINVPWGRILVTDLPPSTVSVSSDVVMLDEQGEASIKNDVLPIGITSKINVNLGEDIRVEALGLKAALMGNLLLTQDSKGTLLNGVINVHNGTYSSFGQDLVIQKGEILFKGPFDKPYLNISAIRNPQNIEDNVIAGIQVIGLASQPKVSLHSNPNMPDQNKLSYILTGHNLDKESDTSTEMMTNLLINLSVSKGGAFLGKIDTVAGAFGIKDFQVGTSGSGVNSKVTVSGYILPGLQLKYGVGIFDALSEFTVRYRIFNNLYIEGIANTAGAVDLLYHISW